MAERLPAGAAIAIDVTFVSGRVTGIERFARDLVEALLANQPPAEIVLLAHRDSEIGQGTRARVLRSPFRNRILTDQLWVPWTLARLRPAFVHFMGLAQPLRCPVPAMATIYDATFWRYPETLSRGGRRYYRPLLERAVRSGQIEHVVAISEAARRDLLEQLPLAPEATSVVLGACAPRFAPASPEGVAEALGRLGLPRRYLLSVGTLEPRKNLPCLLAAFEDLADRYPDLHLVLVGRQGWLDALPLPPGLAGRVHLTGAVADADLPALYSGAAVYAFPSRYEGFGLPLIEAMACGAPCVASTAEALREVGGDACLYASPDDPQEFGRQIARLLDDPDLCTRLAEAGRTRSAAFTWKRSAEELEATYGAFGRRPFRLMGLRLTDTSVSRLLDRFQEAVAAGSAIQVATVNLDFLALAAGDPEYADILRRAEINLVDGKPLVWLARLFGRRRIDRVTGADLTEALCRESAHRGFRLFFLGAAPGVAEQARREAERRFPGCLIAGVYSPTQEELAASDHLIELIAASGANVLLVALGAPKQEFWIACHKERLPTTVNIGVGASIDFLAGRVRRAPAWIGRLGLEWLFRLALEPRRLWRRYLLRDLPFLARLLASGGHLS